VPVLPSSRAARARVEYGRVDVEFRGESRLAAKQPVGPDGIGLAGLAHAGRLADDRREAVERDLEGDDADQLPAVEDRSRDETCRGHQAREVAIEAGVGHRIAGAAGDGLLEGQTEIGAGDGAGPQGGSEVDFLADAVDKPAAGGIDQEQVIEPVLFLEIVKNRVIQGMGLGVGGIIVGRIEAGLLAERVVVAADVEVLKVDRFVVEGRHQRPHLGLSAGRLAVGRRKLAGVEVFQGSAGRGHALLVDAVVGQDAGGACSERPEGRDDHPIFGEHPQFVVEGDEVPLHALAGDGVNRLELLEGLLLEG
jgi:hypothetical protein